MRIVAFLLLIVAMAVAAEQPKNDAAKDDASKLQGTWIGIAVTYEGNKLSDDDAKGVRLVCDGNKYSYDGNGEIRRGTFKIDTKVTPKTLDTSETEGANAGETWLGIYEFDGKNLKLCTAALGKPRPTEFTSEDGSDRHLFVFKHEEK